MFLALRLPPSLNLPSNFFLADHNVVLSWKPKNAPPSPRITVGGALLNISLFKTCKTFVLTFFYLLYIFWSTCLFLFSSILSCFLTLFFSWLYSFCYFFALVEDFFFFFCCYFDSVYGFFVSWSYAFSFFYFFASVDDCRIFSSSWPCATLIVYLCSEQSFFYFFYILEH